MSAFALARRVSACFACLAAVATQAHIASAFEGEAIGKLAGRWSGEGVMTLASGPRESFKCVVTYFPSEDGSRVKQNLRCKGASYNFDAATHLQIAQGRVTGLWEDKVYSLGGSVNGTVTQDGFDVTLSGRFFEAKMTVVSSPCQQSVTITPAGSSDMKQLAAVLKKC